MVEKERRKLPNRGEVHNKKIRLLNPADIRLSVLPSFLSPDTQNTHHMKKVVHFEIPADNMERAKKFYSIFDWQMQDWPMPDGSVYVGCRTVDADPATHIPKEPGAISGGMILRNEVSRTPNITMHVPSIDDYAVKIQQAGG